MTPIGNHTFRASGITAYLGNGGALERAREIAAHEGPRMTNEALRPAHGNVLRRPRWRGYAFERNIRCAGGRPN